jgi:UDP-N-acetylmuramate dehydrogenase
VYPVFHQRLAVMANFSGFEHIVRDGEPLGRHTWFRLGGPAEFFAEPTSVEELSGLVRRCHEEGLPVRLLGGGSNVLARDEGVKGLVIHLSAAPFCAINVQGRTVTAGGGAKLGHVISTTVREGLAGLEQLVGIPGTIGGALHGNAGTHGGDIGQLTHGATVITRSGEMVARRREELNFAYLQSSLDELVILGAQFELDEDDPRELTKRMQKLWIVKKSSQPTSDQSTGSIFRDSAGVSAASLIEQAGLKGHRSGQAEINDRNANFIVAGRGATAQDVLRLIDAVKRQVAEHLGVELELAIDIW